MMFTKLRNKLALSGLLFFVVGNVVAGDLDSAAFDLCEKVKACSIAQIAEADLTPELKQMMEPMLESVCDTMRAGVQEVPSDHPLHGPAVDCMRSMAALSCEDFQDEQKVATPDCRAYQETAEQLAQDT